MTSDVPGSDDPSSVADADPSTGSTGTSPAEIARLEAERARLEAEVGDLHAQLTRANTRRPGRLRRLATIVLVVATSIAVTVAVAGVWARRNALNTDRWVETVGPLAGDPAVQDALGTWMTTELMGVIDAEEFFESVLPERGQVLAAPLASALRGFVDDQVDEFLASDTFQRLWLEVNERAHGRIVDVLEGDVGNLQIEGDRVQVNLIPVLNRVLAEIGEASPDILGRTVDLPTVTVDDVPQDAIDKIENALGRELPDDFGQFTAFEAQRLQQVQDAVSLFDTLVVATVAVALLLIAVTLGLSPYRRRTLLQLMVGIALGVVLVRRLGLRLEDDVVDLVRPENREAVQVVVGAFVSSLLDATAWVLAIVASVFAVALVTAPHGWARGLRQRIASVAGIAGSAVHAAVTRSRDERSAEWVTAHREALQYGGLAVAILVLLVADVSWFGLVLLALVVGAFQLAVWRIADEPVEARSP